MSKQSDPVNRWVQIVNDGSAISEVIRTAEGRVESHRGIFVATTGTIKLTGTNDSTLDFSNLAVGIYPLRPKSSHADTTATLYALYGN